MGNDFILKGTGLEKSYEIAGQKKTKVLKGLSLEIERGEFVAIMGHSGTGKSTLLHILGSLDRPDNGEITLNVNNINYDYKTISSGSFTNIRNKHIGFVFQFHHLLPEFTALENVMMPALIAGVSYNESKLKAEDLLVRVGIINQKDQKPSELSGGEQQRTAIARALINNPAIVFADEPTGNLDKDNASAVLELIKDLKEQFSITFVIATHSLDVALIAGRILYMSDGVFQERN